MPDPDSATDNSRQEVQDAPPYQTQADTSEGSAGAAYVPDEEDKTAEAMKDKEKDNGNEEFAKGNYAAAIKAWTMSLTSVKYILDKGVYNKKPEQLAEVKAMELRLCLNISQGNLKVGDWNQALSYSDRALVVQADHPKALYRKASALMELLSFSEAAAVLERLLQVESNNKAAQAMLAKARRNAEISEKKAKKMSKKMFSVVSSEHDPRVPPTQFEQLIDLLREGPKKAFRYMLNAPQELVLYVRSTFTAALTRVRETVLALRKKIPTNGSGALRKGSDKVD